MRMLATQLDVEKIILIGIGVLFIIEQILYWFLGSYPYRYGITIKRIDTYDTSFSIESKGEMKDIEHLAIKRDDRRREIYIRNKYPAMTIGPLIFVGQVKNDERKLIIRIGPISALFILYIVVSPIIHGGFWELMNTILLIIVVSCFYMRFYNKVKGG
ncbi:MAG: hypothetical protein ACOX2W_10000 [Desulfomonilia bacterium]